MAKGKPDRMSVMPQICYKHAIDLFYKDYRQGIKEVLKEPEKTLELVLKAACYYKVDGLRFFIPSNNADIIDEGKTVKVRDCHSG